MRNPLRSEEAAFRLVLWSLAYFAPIVVAAWIAPWLGLIAFVVATAIVVQALWRGSKSSAPPEPTERAQVEDTPGDDG